MDLIKCLFKQSFRICKHSKHSHSRFVHGQQMFRSLNLQYVNPTAYSKLLSAIVLCDKPNLQTKLETSIAASIRIDGSIDRTQLDKIYIMLKILTKNGDKELIFIGIAEQNIRGATGLLEAVKRGIIENLGEDVYIAIMKKISSIKCQFRR